MSQQIPVVELPSRELKHNARLALGDVQLRSNMRTAMDSLMAKRLASMPDEYEREHLRELGNHVRARALSQLPDLLEKLEAQPDPQRRQGALGRDHRRGQRDRPADRRRPIRPSR